MIAVAPDTRSGPSRSQSRTQTPPDVTIRITADRALLAKALRLRVRYGYFDRAEIEDAFGLPDAGLKRLVAEPYWWAA